MSDFEKKIWDDFFGTCQTTPNGQQLGIRAAHAGAPFMKVEKGEVVQDSAARFR